MKLAYRKMSVLMVDTMALDTLKGYLEEFQFFRLWTAKSSTEALEILDSKPVELVISGCALKPMSGFQLLEAVRKHPQRAQLPFLLMIDPKQGHQKEQGEQKGATGFLTLPLEAKQVKETVAQVLEPFIDPEEEAFQQNLFIARRALRKNDLRTAEKHFRKALEIKMDPETQLTLGKVLRQLGDLEAAEKAFIAALRANPLSLRAFLGLAAVYQAMGRMQDALKVLAGALRAAKKLKQSGGVTASIYFYIGEIELQLNQLSQALSHFEQAAESDPQNADLQVAAGDALAQAGHLAESEKFYQRALQLDPELAHVYNKLGIAYRKQGKFDLARNLFLKALAFHPEDEHLHYNIGRLYWDMQEYEKASRILTRALKLNPEFEEAQRLLDVVLHQMGYQVTQDGDAPQPPPEEEQ